MDKPTIYQFINIHDIVTLLMWLPKSHKLIKKIHKKMNKLRLKLHFSAYSVISEKWKLSK